MQRKFPLSNTTPKNHINNQYNNQQYSDPKRGYDERNNGKGQHNDRKHDRHDEQYDNHRNTNNKRYNDDRSAKNERNTKKFESTKKWEEFLNAYNVLPITKFDHREFLTNLSKELTFSNTLNHIQVNRLINMLHKNFLKSKFVEECNDPKLHMAFNDCVRRIITQFNTLCEEKAFEMPKNTDHLQSQLMSLPLLITYLGEMSSTCTFVFSPAHLNYVLNHLVNLIQSYREEKRKININNQYQKDGQLRILLQDLISKTMDGVNRLIGNIIKNNITSEEMECLLALLNTILEELINLPDYKTNKISCVFSGFAQIAMVMEKELPEYAFNTAHLKTLIEHGSEFINNPKDIVLILSKAGIIAWKNQLNITIDATTINQYLKKLTPLSKTSIGVYKVCEVLAGINNLLPMIDGQIDAALINELLEINPADNFDIQRIGIKIESFIKSSKLNGSIKPEKIKQFLKPVTGDNWVDNVLNKAEDSEAVLQKTMNDIFENVDPIKNLDKFNDLYNKIKGKLPHVKTLAILAKCLNESQSKFLLKTDDDKFDKKLKEQYSQFIKLAFAWLKNLTNREATVWNDKNSQSYIHYLLLTIAHLLYHLGYISGYAPCGEQIRSTKYLLEKTITLINRYNSSNIKQDDLVFNVKISNVISRAILGASYLFKFTVSEEAAAQHFDAIASPINSLLEQLQISDKTDLMLISIALNLLTEKLGLNFITNANIEKILFGNVKILEVISPADFNRLCVNTNSLYQRSNFTISAQSINAVLKSIVDDYHGHFYINAKYLSNIFAWISLPNITNNAKINSQYINELLAKIEVENSELINQINILSASNKLDASIPIKIEKMASPTCNMKQVQKNNEASPPNANFFIAEPMSDLGNMEDDFLLQLRNYSYMDIDHIDDAIDSQAKETKAREESQPILSAGKPKVEIKNPVSRSQAFHINTNAVKAQASSTEKTAEAASNFSKEKAQNNVKKKSLVCTLFIPKAERKTIDALPSIKKSNVSALETNNRTSDKLLSPSASEFSVLDKLPFIDVSKKDASSSEDFSKKKVPQNINKQTQPPTGNQGNKAPKLKFVFNATLPELTPNQTEFRKK